MPGIVLYPELLDRLVEHPAVQGAPVLDAWAPGLTDAEMDELTVPIGIRLPEELRVLWRWHNGPVPGFAQRQLAGFDALSLQDAVASYHLERKISVDAGLPPEESFPARFLPFAESYTDTTAADCSHPENAIAPVHHLSMDSPREEHIATPEVASLGDWATWQLKALDDGQYWWDANDKQWAVPRPMEDDRRPQGPAFLQHLRGWR